MHVFVSVLKAAGQNGDSPDSPAYTPLDRWIGS